AAPRKSGAAARVMAPTPWRAYQRAGRWAVLPGSAVKWPERRARRWSVGHAPPIRSGDTSIPGDRTHPGAGRERGVTVLGRKRVPLYGALALALHLHLGQGLGGDAWHPRGSASRTTATARRT